MKTTLIQLIFSALSFLVPTKNKLFLFGSWYGDKYGDNPRYFFEWLSANEKATECFWVTKNLLLYQQLKAKNINVVYGKSLKVIWLHLRAQAIFCNCSPTKDLYAEFLNRKTSIFNLWHGTPIKKIGFDAISSNISSQRLGIKRTHFLTKLMPKPLVKAVKWIKDKDVFYLASSKKVAIIYSSAMGVDNSKVIVNGYPKLDHLITEPRTVKKGSILYAPTYRGDYNSENDLLTLFGFDISKVDLWLKNNGSTLTIRLHPANKLPEELISKIKNALCIDLGGTGDLYEEITDYDLVVTDFSSLFYDAISVDIKAVIAPFGLNSYINEDRQLYFTPDELFPYPKANNWPELLSLLPSYFSGEFDMEKIKSEFYIDKQGMASQGLWDKVQNIIKG